MNRTFIAKNLLVIFVFSLTTFVAKGQTSETLKNAWTAFNRNQRPEARTLFVQASNQTSTAAEANLGLAMMAWTDENSPKANEYVQKFYEQSKDPFPYLYALWSTGSFMGGSGGKKTESQFKFIQKLAQDPRANGTMKAMFQSALGGHYENSFKTQEALAEYAKIGSIDHWQVLGTFENTSGSGFNKDFGALAKPQATATFKNKVGAEIKWFDVPAERSDKWFDFSHFFIIDNSVMYAQTFVQSDIDQEAILRSGCSGSMKVWVNDKLVTNEATERNCDLDLFVNTIRLAKGYNRILVQIAESETSRANFLIRITDKQGLALAGLKSLSQPQPYTKAVDYQSESLTFFAEEYFENKIKQEPNDLINYILLAETYLRNDKAYESRKFLKKAKELAPESTFLSGVLIEAYLREQNQTELTKEREAIRSKDPESMWGLQISFNEAIEKEDFTTAEPLLAKIKSIYGQTQYTDFTELGLLAKQKKFDDVFKASDYLYKTYPDSPEAINLAFIIESEVRKDPKAATAILTKYLANNFNSKVSQDLAKVYFQAGNKQEGLEQYKNRIKAFPYSVGFHDDLADQYFGLTDYKNALVYRQKVMEFVPYIGYYWKKLAETYEILKQPKEAIEAYKKAVLLQPTLFEAHKALRRLESKVDLFEHFTKINADAIFKASATAKDFPTDNSIVLINEMQRVVYPQGTTEERDELLTKILTQEGIDTWKQYEIPFNGKSQNYIIEKAEVLKADGSKVKAETNENALVFTGLQVGDAIHVIYRLEDYSSGMLGQHFNDRMNFSLGYPVQLARYSLLIPTDKTFQYKTLHTDVKASTKNIENFKLYSWELQNQEALSGESYMPVLGDAVATLEVSTLPSWKFIGQWYTDLASTKAKADFEVQETVAEVFKNQPKKLSDLQKAKLIYNYIENNINYLSVAFMQSGLVPQKASRTLSTKLGDCKDLSTLFVAMCKQVGVKANLVLVSTRNNGDSTMLLPSINFNHCIANLETEGKNFFIELTDTKNAFGAVSANLLNANGLIIPREDQNIESRLIKINTQDRSKNAIYRYAEVGFEQKDLTAKVINLKTGSLASDMRHNNANIGNEEQEKKLSESIASDFTNVVKVSSVVFRDLEVLSDSLQYEYTYRVKNELSEVAGMKIFRLPWAEKLSSLDFVSAETRKFPFMFWAMFETETMQETITLSLPTGKKLLEIPEGINLSTSFADFKLSFETKGDKLIATRILTPKIDIIAPNQYPAFREFFNKVVEADTKQFAFK